MMNPKLFLSSEMGCVEFDSHNFRCTFTHNPSLRAEKRLGEDNKDKLIEELKQNDEDTEGLRQGEVLMRVVTWLDFVNDPLQVKLLRRNNYPFVVYQGDINPLEIYGESWAKHVIPMNRVLNALESSAYQYNYKYGKGRIVIDKNSGVRIITNEHGDIIEKNQGSTVTSLPLEPLQASYAEQIVRMRQYIEDVGGAHDVSLGRIPTGVKSGVGIAELKQADSTNQTDLADNMEDFLIQIGMKILAEIADNYDVPKIIKVLGKEGKPEHFAVVGENSGKKRKNQKEVKIGPDVFDIAMIGKDNQISVKIGSWLAYTKEAQQDKLKEYYMAGLIDQKTFLEHAEFSDVDNIVEQTRQEEILKKYRGNQAQGQAGPSDEELATTENVMMVNEGKDMPVSPDDVHPVHLIVHQEHADNPLVSKHMSEHELLEKQGVEMQAKTAQPITPPTPPAPAGVRTMPPPPSAMMAQAQLPPVNPQIGPIQGGI